MTDLIGGEAVYAPHRERAKDDFMPTPPEPTRALLHAEGPRLRELLQDFPCIWECAAGDGAMVREMVAAGFPVHASDKVDRGCGAEIRSFETYSSADAPSRIIVTNPPYDRINWRDGRGFWLQHAIETIGVGYMALLLSWSWPGAGGLGPLWERHPPSRVYLMRWKIDFTGDGAPPMLNAWFVWDGNTDPDDVRLLMLDRVDARQGELLRDIKPSIRGG
jgi:hypothetical protein